MHPLLEKYLDKKSIASIDQLDADEKATLKQWEVTLKGKEVTVADVVDFCQVQLGFIERQFDNLDTPAGRNDRLVLMHSLYRKICTLLTAPQKERAALEAKLTDMIYSE